MVDTHIGSNTKSKKIYLGNEELAKLIYDNNVVYDRGIYNIVKNGVLNESLRTWLEGETESDKAKLTTTATQKDGYVELSFRIDIERPEGTSGLCVPYSPRYRENYNTPNKYNITTDFDVNINHLGYNHTVAVIGYNSGNKTTGAGETIKAYNTQTNFTINLSKQYYDGIDSSNLVYTLAIIPTISFFGSSAGTYTSGIMKIRQLYFYEIK